MDMSNYIEANWHQVKGKVREKFGKLTDDDMLEVAGRIETLVGKLQERYDISTEEAEQMVTGLHLDADGMELETALQGEGNYEASRRFQDAQHEFAAENTDAGNNVDGGKSTLSDAGQYDIATAEGEVSAEVSADEAERIKRDQKERTENYIHRS
ncbi:CsbD family protein [Thiothrix nivea]|uniref:CsbD family protein n=1 Tax=Thiothrix nivea (strain ATCC 35100 / DSM 5205 / JP2) TaxID=870187 RepID=A0A656HJ12_THINJ|nr:CsbD family protein [Thiothrix nivea DSM 5205]